MMAWLDDRLRDHPKIIRASAPAFRHWALALCYCSAHGTGGRLDEAVKALAVPSKVVAELVELKLWDRENDGLWVHDWQEHNAKRDADNDARRESARERQRRHRAKLRGQDPDEVTRDETVTSHTSNASLSRVTDPRAGARPRHARDHDQEERKTDLAAAARNGVTPQPAAAAPNDEEHTTTKRLELLGLSTNVDLDLARAWLDLAATEAQTNPAGYVAAGIRTGAPPSARLNGSDAGKTRASGEPDYEAKAAELFERTGDRERVADWLAGLTRLSPPERDRILVAVAGAGSVDDDEPDLG